MSKNPVLPYAVIALIGVLVVIIISYVGVNQRNAIENPVDEGEVTVLNAEDIYKASCANCHGGDLSGTNAPALSQVGGKFSEEEINDIINNGTDGGMPPALVKPDEAEILAEWLSEKK